MKRFETATEVPDTGDPVFDRKGTWHQDVTAYAELEGDDADEFVFASVKRTWELEIDWEAERERFADCACFDDPDPIDSQFANLKGKDELQAAIDRFNALNAGAVQFDIEDWTRKIRVPRDGGGE